MPTDNNGADACAESLRAGADTTAARGDGALNESERSVAVHVARARAAAETARYAHIPQQHLCRAIERLCDASDQLLAAFTQLRHDVRASLGEGDAPPGDLRDEKAFSNKLLTELIWVGTQRDEDRSALEASKAECAQAKRDAVACWDDVPMRLAAVTDMADRIKRYRRDTDPTTDSESRLNEHSAPKRGHGEPASQVNKDSAAGHVVQKLPPMPALKTGAPPLVYVAGRYRAQNAWRTEQNIRAAEAVAYRIAELGAYPVCPHTNTRHYFESAQVDAAFWLNGTLEMMRRCDAVVFINGWRESAGAQAEHTEAVLLGMRVFVDDDGTALGLWLERNRNATP